MCKSNKILTSFLDAVGPSAQMHIATYVVVHDTELPARRRNQQLPKSFPSFSGRKSPWEYLAGSSPCALKWLCKDAIARGRLAQLPGLCMIT